MKKEIDIYLANSRQSRGISPRTYKSWVISLRLFMIWLIDEGIISWGELTIGLLDRYKKYSLTTVTPVTWNSRGDCIKNFLRYLYSSGIIKEPLHEYTLRIINAIIIKKDALTEEDYITFIGYLKALGDSHGDLRLKLSNSLMVIEGLRVEEVSNLKLSTNPSVLSTKILKVFGKGSRNRDVYLSNTTFTWLKEYLLAREDYFKFRGVDSTDSLIVSNYLEALSPRSIQKHLDKISLKTIPGLNPMRLRKTAITRAVARMPNLKYLPQLAMHFGHTIGVMQKYYLSQDATQISSIIDSLD